MSLIRRTQAEYDEMVRKYETGMSLNKPTWMRRMTKEEKKDAEKVKRKRALTYKEGKFVEGKIKGMTGKDAAIFAGYSVTSAANQASLLMKKEKITRVLEKAGLTDKVLADTIKKNMQAGTGIKATADTSLKAVELALKLKGHLQPEEKTETTNIQINDLRNMSDEDLQKKLEVLQGEVIE